MPHRSDPVTLLFHGHACWSITFADGRSLVLDPWTPGALGGALALPPLPDTFTWSASTHEHPDHDGGRSLSSALPLSCRARTERFSIDYWVAGHDEHGGRLRGGSVRVLDVRAGGIRIVHCGDLGERPAGAFLAWLRAPRVDALLTPVGGHYTLGADGAAELVARCQPRFALPFHASEDGCTLSELSSRRGFLARWPRWEERPQLSLSVPDSPDSTTTVVVLRRTSDAGSDG
jgi:L-ascorbate metabolism protein UlaG (beta-lactamase superfamily)